MSDEVQNRLDTIHCGDALQWLKGLPEESVDVCLTDPPYSSGTRREGQKGVRKSMTRGTAGDDWFGSDCLTTNGFTWLMRECALEWRRVLKPGGHVLCFIDWRMMPHLAGAIESSDLRHAGLIVWDKTYFGMGTHFRNQHEMVVHFTKGRAMPAVQRDQGNVIRCAPERNSMHPTAKPVELLRALLRVVAPEGAIVLDPFAGCGPTCVAAINQDLHFLACERSPSYVRRARVRIKEAQEALALFEPTERVSQQVLLASGEPE